MTPVPVSRLTPEDIRQEALTLRGMGWSVFPLTGKKTARVRWRQYQHRRPSDRELDRMFALDGVGGLAVVAGRVSGGDGCSLVIRDFDNEDGYDRWRRRNPRLAADAPTVHTRRGYHAYVRVRGYVPWQKLSDGELIADSKHIAVVPPSRHPSGTVYQWVPYPPLGVSDFPVLTLSATDFIPTGTKAEKAQERRRETEVTCVPNGVIEIPDTAVREAILRTLPRGPGERNDRLKYFARSLRDLYPPTVRAKDLCPFVGEWFRLAEPVVTTKDFLTTWNEFRALWAGVTTPVSMSLPMVAMTTAAKGATGPDRLKAACAAMAGQTPDGVFHLSARTAAKVTGLSKSQACRELNTLRMSGFLKLVTPGTRGAKARRAAEYRLAR